MEALRGIGCPSRICFMLDTTGNNLLVMPYRKRDFKSHSIPRSVYSTGAGMEINSMKLCRIIANLHGLDYDKSFRFPGFVDVDERIAVFDLTKGQEIRQLRGVYRSHV